MCQRIKADKSFKQGSLGIIAYKGGTKLLSYGFNEGQVWNARWETIETTWRNMNKNRGIFKVDCFWEGNGCFKRADKRDFNIGVIWNLKDEFAIITVAANKAIVPFHSRGPLCLEEDSVPAFLEGSKDIRQLDSGLYEVVNKIAA